MVSSTFQKLWEKQNPELPEDARFLVYRICNGDHGVGSEMHMMVQAFSLALHTKRVFIIEGDWQFSGSDYFYWFEPITGIQPDFLDGKDFVSLSPGALNEARFIRIEGGFDANQLKQDYSSPIEEFKQFSAVLWLSHLLCFLMRPNEYLRNLLESEKRRLGLPEKYIGAQIRHSTTWVYNRRNIPLYEFMDCVKFFAKKTKIQDVFVSTENQRVIDRLKNYSNFSFFYTDNHRSNLNQARAIMAGQLCGEEEGRIAMLNLFLMKDASALVAGFRSNWGRLVLEHMLVKESPPRNIVGLDTPLASPLIKTARVSEVQQMTYFHEFFISSLPEFRSVRIMFPLKRVLFDAVPTLKLLVTSLKKSGFTRAVKRFVRKFIPK